MATLLRIVLADDHEIVRTGLRTLIDGSADMSVVGEAGDGETACAMARDLAPDVVVMDVAMPGMDGAAATECIRARSPAVRVIALTMHEDRGHLKRLMGAGAAGYVLKRAAAEELVRAIRLVAAGGTYVDPQLAGRVLRTPTPDTETVSGSGDPLSEREEEVLRRTAWGQTNKEIAGDLAISTKTVETYKARITAKTGLRSRTEIVRFALQQGWLSTQGS